MRERSESSDLKADPLRALRAALPRVLETLGRGARAEDEKQLTPCLRILFFRMLTLLLAEAKGLITDRPPLEDLLAEPLVRGGKESFEGMQGFQCRKDSLDEALHVLQEACPDFAALPADTPGLLYEELLALLRMERRRSGSYYTRRELVDELIRSALHPLARRARDADGLLGLKVVDPACGGGAFLIAAQDFLARKVALLRTGKEDPDRATRIRAKRDVLLNCIHGVERDPTAAKLARIGLWLNTGTKELPAGVLESKIKSGDALIGIPLKGHVLRSRKECDRWTAALLRDEAERQPAKRYGFFHWPLEFPEVFRGVDPGFDCVLGNPPWERIKIQEKEFFARSAPAIARAKKASERRRMIQSLRKDDPLLFGRYEENLHRSTAFSRYLRNSGRYRLVRGDPNTYLFFAVLFRDLLNSTGRAGMIVPSGIATDLGAAPFFQDLVEKESLVSLYDFVNTSRLFPGIAGPNRFCLLTLAGSANRTAEAAFLFYASSMEDLRLEDRRFHLSKADLKLLNPNTGTCPPFPGRVEAERMKALYRRFPVLKNESKPEQKDGGWKVTLWNMFHMSGHSHLFQTRDQMEKQGFCLDGEGNFRRGSEVYLRLYEAKLMHNLNHRYNTFEGVDPRKMAAVKPGALSVTDEQAQKPGYAVLPRYWVPEGSVRQATRRRGRERPWFLCLRSVTNVTTNRRTVMAAVLPWCGVGNSATVLSSPLAAREVVLLAACLSSFALDYAARMKVGGPNLNFFILKQLPVPPTQVFDRPFQGGTLRDFIWKRAFELIYTAKDLIPFARECGHSGPPFPWDNERRAKIRAELDGLFFILYGFSPSDAAAAMDSFPILERQERARFGTYLTRKRVLAACEEYTALY